MEILLAPAAWSTMEFPHLLRLIEENQFDTIYHEHFSYFSFLTARKIFAAHGLALFDVEELPTSRRVHCASTRRMRTDGKPVHDRVRELRKERPALVRHARALY